MPHLPERAGLPRRLAGMFYDTLLLLALLMAATALFLLLTGGEAVDPGIHPALEFIYRLVLVALIVGFSAYPGRAAARRSAWRRGGCASSARMAGSSPGVTPCAGWAGRSCRCCRRASVSPGC